MPSVSDISRFLGDFAPLVLAEAWDNVGLLVGDLTRPAQRILTCLTITPDVVEEAVALQVELIVSHHPLLFKPVQRLTAGDIQGAMLLKLIEAGIAVYSPHTAFDSAAEGINRQLADQLALRNVQPLRLRSGAGDSLAVPSGAGRFGDLDHACTLAELCDTVKQTLQVTRLQRVGDGTSTVCRVGIACGAAAEFIPDALNAGCDVLLTGEARFHDCLRARDSGLALILPGHYATERPAVENLAAIIQRQFPGTSVSASSREHDPVEII